MLFLLQHFCNTITINVNLNKPIFKERKKIRIQYECQTLRTVDLQKFSRKCSEKILQRIAVILKILRSHLNPWEKKKKRSTVFMSLLKLRKFSKTPVIFRSILLPRQAMQFMYLNLDLQFGLCERRGEKEERVTDTCQHSQPSQLNGRGQCTLPESSVEQHPSSRNDLLG